MNKDQIIGNWKAIKGKVREKWGELTDDDLEVIGGQRDMLVGKLQAVYGLEKENAERAVKEFLRSSN